MTRVLKYLADHGLAVIALIAALLALATGSYAAFTISGSQIRNHTIDPVKLDPKFINGTVRAWAIVGPNAHVIAGAGGPKVSAQLATPGAYGIRWRVRINRCSTDVTIDSAVSPPTERVSIAGNPSVPFTAGYATGTTSRAHNETAVQTFNQQGQPTPLGFDVAVIC